MTTNHPLDDAGSAEAPSNDTDTRRPDWWHRDHPTFTALTGFFTGLAFVIVIPGAFAAILSAFFDYETAEDLFPFVVLTLAVPIGLLVAPRTRRFGRYLVIGMVSTLLVVLGVAAIVLWVLVSLEG